MRSTKLKSSAVADAWAVGTVRSMIAMAGYKLNPTAAMIGARWSGERSRLQADNPIVTGHEIQEKLF